MKAYLNRAYPYKTYFYLDTGKAISKYNIC